MPCPCARRRRHHRSAPRAQEARAPGSSPASPPPGVPPPSSRPRLRRRHRHRHRLSRGSCGPAPFTSGEGREEGDEGLAGSSGRAEHLGVTGLKQPTSPPPPPFFAKTPKQNRDRRRRRSRPPAPSLHLAGRHRGQLGCPVSCEPRT